MNSRTLSAAKPLLPMISLTLIHSIGLTVLAVRGIDALDESRLLWNFGFALCVVHWVANDRRSRGFSVPFEFDAILFFAWVFVVPYYLFRTRGARGLINAIGFWVLAFAPDMISATILVARRL